MMDCGIIIVCGREGKTVVLTRKLGWFAMDNDRGKSSNGDEEPLV